MSPELVTVLETADTFALSLAKASLDEAGIAYVVDGDDVPRYIARFQEAPGLGATPLWACSCRIQVATGFATEGVAAGSAAGLQLAARAYQGRTGWLVPQRPAALPPSNLALPFTVEARLISVSG